MPYMTRRWTQIPLDYGAFLVGDLRGGSGVTVCRGGATVIQRDAPIEPHVYQQHLEEGLHPARLYKDSVRYWSDFNRVYFHPRSIVQLNEYELNSSLMPFEQWDAGDDLFSSLDKDHDLLDRDLRPFVEEADQMQGFQVMTGADDAWGGFASRYVERIRDEYGKTAVWVWAEEEDLKSVPRVSIATIRMYDVARLRACHTWSTSGTPPQIYTD